MTFQYLSRLLGLSGIRNHEELIRKEKEFIYYDLDNNVCVKYVPKSLADRVKKKDEYGPWRAE